jgi:hypothetical protein
MPRECRNQLFTFPSSSLTWKHPKWWDTHYLIDKVVFDFHLFSLLIIRRTSNSSLWVYSFSLTCQRQPKTSGTHTFLNHTNQPISLFIFSFLLGTKRNRTCSSSSLQTHAILHPPCQTLQINSSLPLQFQKMEPPWDTKTSKLHYFPSSSTSWPNNLLS